MGRGRVNNQGGTHTKKHTVLLSLSEIQNKIILAVFNKGTKLIT